MQGITKTSRLIKTPMIATFVALVLLGQSFFSAVAQETSDGNSTSAPLDFDSYFPTATAIRIETDEAPTIDGDISDAVWSRAQPITDFYQVEPNEGVAPSEPTTAYILYDERQLYVAIYAYDSEPEEIRRSQLQRDARLRDDDAVRVFIDSYGTFRDSFFFGVNPNGARTDALTENNNSFQPNWNTIWRAKARVVEDGWVAEFAIPFQSFSFDSSLDEWNFQIIRTIRRHNEEIRWSNIDQNRGRIDLTNPGRLAGINNVSSGKGLEVQAFVSGAGTYDWETDQTDYQLNPSGNVFYKITPSLTGSLTFNTDFSDAPLDARQVNTGRFSLFFPETRDFFLQDSAVFEFGGRSITNNQNGMPFFSRNIGIVNGMPVDIIAGAKLSGKAGPANVGVISTRTGSVDFLDDNGLPQTIDGQYLSSARVSIPVLAESKAGIVFTNGDPTGETNNTVAGADFQFKRSNFLGDGTLTADMSYVRSFTDGVEDDLKAVELSYRSQKWNGRARFRELGDNYSPKLGFANRTGIRRYTFNAWRNYRPKDSFIRFAETGGWTNIITDTDGNVEDRFFGFFAGGMNNDGDELWLNYEHGFVDIADPFDIAGVVPVSAGQYTWDQYSVRVETTNSRKIGVEFSYQWGGVYGGDLNEIGAEISLRPSKHFELRADYRYLDFDLPGGQVGIHISSINSTIAFTPDMTIKTEIQYDNISEAFTYFSRFAWEPRPEREIFLSFGHTATIGADRFPTDFRSQSSTLALRLGHTFRM